MIPKGFKLVDTQDLTGHGGGLRKYYETDPIDTPDYEVTKTLCIHVDGDGKVSEHRSQSKKQKFLCVNGPEVGKKLTWKRGQELGYISYNCSESYYYKKDKNFPKCILVFYARVAQIDSAGRS